MISQKYRDLTFLFGPPSGDRYEMLKTTALQSEDNFSSVYRTYMGKMFSSFEECGLFDKVFSDILGVDLRINRIFPTYQFWLNRNEKFSKFYLSPDDKSIEIPALMFFPPEFTYTSGAKLNVCVELQDAQYVSAIMGKSLKLDWVQINGVLSEDESN